MSTPILTVANQLTLLRMGLAPLLVVLVVQGRMGWALGVFVVAGVTDALDGLIARLGRQQTTLGAMLDPVADKVLMTSSFIALTWCSGLAVAIPVWLTVVILSRDAIIIVSVAIVNLTVGRRIFYPSLLGKLCTVSQLLTVGLVLLANVLGRGEAMLRYLFIATLALTVASALHYVYLASTRGPGRVPEEPAA
jgi:cardiolipin synthase (CMP-forming)